MANQLHNYFKFPQPRSNHQFMPIKSQREKSRKLSLFSQQHCNRPMEEKGGANQEGGGFRKMKKQFKDVIQRMRENGNFCSFPLLGFWLLASCVTLHLKKLRVCDEVMKNSSLENNQESFVNAYFSVPVVPPPATASAAYIA